MIFDNVWPCDDKCSTYKNMLWVRSKHVHIQKRLGQGEGEINDANTDITTDGMSKINI